MLTPLELKLLKGWLTVLSVFEVPNLYGYLISNIPMNGFFSTMKNRRAEKRCWSMVLCLLCFARIQAAMYTDSPGVLANNAAVHILEAVAFGYEKFKYGSNGSSEIYLVILGNALWFLSAAMRQ
jgi:hypothetical protein